MLENTRTFIDRASRRTVNQITAEKAIKTIREIKDITKRLPSTMWAGDRVERVGRWGIAILSLSAVVSAHHLSNLEIPGMGVRSPGFLERLVDVKWGAGEVGSSCLLVLSIMVEWVKIREETRWGRNGYQDQTTSVGLMYTWLLVAPVKGQRNLTRYRLNGTRGGTAIPWIRAAAK